MALEKEFEFYVKNRDAFIDQGYEGKFVVIKDQEILDFFAAYEDALRQGLKKYGNVPFLIKEISRFERINFFFHGVSLECQA